MARGQGNILNTLDYFHINYSIEPLATNILYCWRFCLTTKKLEAVSLISVNFDLVNLWNCCWGLFVVIGVLSVLGSIKLLWPNVWKKACTYIWKSTFGRGKIYDIKLVFTDEFDTYKQLLIYFCTKNISKKSIGSNAKLKIGERDYQLEKYRNQDRDKNIVEYWFRFISNSDKIFFNDDFNTKNDVILLLNLDKQEYKKSLNKRDSMNAITSYRKDCGLNV